MRVTAAAADLTAALKHSVAARTTPMPILQHTLLTAANDVLHLETSDTEIFVRQTIPAKVEESGSICLTDALLRTIASGGGDVILRSDGKVSRGRSHFTVGALPAEDFPTPESSQFEPLKVDPEALREAIREVDYAYGDGDIRPFVRAVHLEPGRVWSTNGNQLGRVTIAYAGPAVRIPGAQLKRLIGALVEDARVLADVRNGKVAMLRVETDTTQITVRCIDTTAPDVNAIIPHMGKREHVRVNRRDLADAVRRMLPFLATKAKAASVVKVTQSAEGLGILDVGSANVEHVGIETPPGAVEAMELGIDANYLLAALGAITTEVVELYLSTSAPCVFLPDGGDAAQVAHIIMPCRL